ncbi:MAG TPA: spore coat U domain-containing protein [Acetobacteraceae bacterium]|jgi:spore coat protein U-like protein|nr:spore coat U domain-containing protein [Acetobacteraceae bacterium]
MPNVRKKVRLLACSGLVVASAIVGLPVTPVEAATTANTTFQVTATVLSTCLISASNLGFGNYSGAAATGTATITVTCTNTSPYNVGLNAGTASGATVTSRKMVGPGGATLAYQLTQDSAHVVNWGQTVGTDTVAGTGNGSAQTLTVYGQVAAGQYVAPGAYSDTITATITY